MKNFITLSRAALTAAVLCLAEQASAQIMISYDNNEYQDLVGSYEAWEDGAERNSMRLDFDYADENNTKLISKVGFYMFDEEEQEEMGGSVDCIWLPGILKFQSPEAEEIPTYLLNEDNLMRTFTGEETICDENGYYLGDVESLYTFEYDENKCMKGYTVEIKDEENPEKYEVTIAWENGNIVEIKGRGTRRVFTYGNELNNTNTDFGLFGYIEDCIDPVPLGKWSKYFPRTIETYVGDELCDKMELSYEKDYADRVQKIVAAYTDYEGLEEDEEPETDVSSLLIHYYGEANGIARHEEGASRAVGIYDVTGQRIPAMKRGVNIVRMANGKTRKVLK